MINVKDLGPISNVKLFKEGSIIIRENHINTQMMYIIINGSVKLVKGYGTENQEIEDTLGSGQLFGEQCLFTDKNPTASVVAETPVSAICVTKEYFIELTKNNPRAIYMIMGELCNLLTLAKESGPKKKASVQVVKVEDSKVSLLPAKHKGYGIPMPESFEDYILTAQKKCPFCKTQFKTQVPYVSKLKLKQPAGCDMRKHYTDFEITWFEVITCPNCYFSCYEEYFDNESIIYKSPEVVKTLKEVHEIYKLNFEEERNLEFVFICHYLSLLSAKAFDNEKQITARLWLELTYLYADAKDMEMYQYSVEKAKEMFELFYGSVNMRPEMEQYCCLVLAHLCFELKDEKNAVMYINKVRTTRDGTAVYKNMAENRYYDYKEEKEAQKATEQAALESEES